MFIIYNLVVSQQNIVFLSPFFCPTSSLSVPPLSLILSALNFEVSVCAVEKASSECDSQGGTGMAANMQDCLLSSDQIEEFHRRGVLVVRNFLSADEVHEARRGEDIIRHKVHWMCSL